MQTYCRKRPLTFAGFVTVAPDAWNGPLAERWVEPPLPLSSARKAVPTAGHKAGFPARIVVKLRAAIASHVPVGYEDETGFHYGAYADGRLFVFDSGGQPLFSEGFFTPTSLATGARIDYQRRSDLRWLKAII